MSKKDKKTRKSWKERLRERQIRYQRTLESHRIRMEREAERKPKRWSRGKILGAVCLIAIVLGVFAAWQSIQPYNQSYTPNTSQGETQTPPSSLAAIYIRANGSIDPSTAPISKVKKDQYVFTADIYLPIVIERDNIILDGNGHVLQGMNVYGSKGIDLTDRSGVTVKNITIKGFDYGVYLVSASNNVLLQNNLTDNYCGVWLAYSSRNLIISNTMTNNDFCGIWLKNSLSNKIYKNTLTSHYNYTIYLGYSNNTIIDKNTLANNHLSIFLYSSVNNSISGNNITQNYQGIHLSSSSQNLLTKNTFSNNNIGLGLSDSSNNTIHHNNFIENDMQVTLSNSENIWDDGKEGNYWSNYKDMYPQAEESDGSGIWNTAYSIDENNIDRFPRTKPAL